MFRSAVLCALCLLFLSAQAALAEVYKWVDEDGNTHFGDVPPRDLETEQLQLPARPTDTQDEGDLRRLRLLRQADRDAAARLKQREAEGAEEEERRAREAEGERRCTDLRRQLDILSEQMPVYRDDAGRLRTKWQRDPYQGPREYLDDAARAVETRRVREAIAADCGRVDDADAQGAAHQEQVYAERCEAAQAELEALERPGARSSESSLEEKRGEVRFYCGQ